MPQSNGVSRDKGYDRFDDVDTMHISKQTKKKGLQRLWLSLGQKKMELNNPKHFHFVRTYGFCRLGGLVGPLTIPIFLPILSFQ